MYFESHIIVRQPFDTAKVRDISRGQGWWGAILRHDESEEELAGDFILTTRGDKQDELLARVSTLVRTLKANGANVRRYKIEHATVDSVRDDVLKLIDPEKWDDE